MATVFKKTTTKPIPGGAKLETIKGRPSAQWAGKGKARTAPLSEDGSRIVIESAQW